MELTTDERSQGDFKNEKIVWSALDKLAAEATGSVEKGLTMAKALLNENSDDIVKSGVDIDAIKGVILSFKDIKTEIDTTKAEHADRKGYVNNEDFDEYMGYIRFVTKYQNIMENTATLIATAYMDVLNTASLKSNSAEVREAAAKSRDSLKETVDAVKEEKFDGR